LPPQLSENKFPFKEPVDENKAEDIDESDAPIENSNEDFNQAIADDLELVPVSRECKRLSLTSKMILEDARSLPSTDYVKNSHGEQKTSLMSEIERTRQRLKELGYDISENRKSVTRQASNSKMRDTPIERSKHLIDSIAQSTSSLQLTSSSAVHLDTSNRMSSGARVDLGIARRHINEALEATDKNIEKQLFDIYLILQNKFATDTMGIVERTLHTYTKQLKHDVVAALKERKHMSRSSSQDKLAYE